MNKEAKLKRWFNWIKSSKTIKNDPESVDVFVSYPVSYNAFQQVHIDIPETDK